MYDYLPQDYEHQSLHNVTFTNLGNFTSRSGEKLNLTNYYKNGFRKASAKFEPIPTTVGEIEVDFALYYR